MKIVKKDKNLRTIIKAIKNGKVIVCPTDTVYGLISDVASKRAVNRIFKIKKREISKPIPVFVRNLKAAKKIAEINKNQEKILRKFWPGKITAVFKRKKTKIKLYGIDKKTIALRVPKYRLINVLLKKINRPLAGTSANISGKPAETRIKEVLRQFENKKNRPDLIIDAGNLKESKPSKVIDLTGSKPKVLRR
jgi:L-threonylcarbamoyladenylate synthase